uniref:Uncharacterized protein n=1 Tax=Anopheles atroparvus TaxID=41427 RepID=A0AAG5DRK2_ANOAO
MQGYCVVVVEVQHRVVLRLAPVHTTSLRYAASRLVGTKAPTAELSLVDDGSSSCN